MTLIYQQKNKLLILSILLLSFLPLVSNAQTAVSMSVSPAIFEMNANPGQTWESKLRVTNNNPFELTIYAQSVNFKPLGEDGTAQFIPIDDNDEKGSTLGEWINVPTSALVIPPEQTLEIPIKISLPSDAPPGGHYAAILAGTRPPKERTDVTKVETSQIVSSLILLRVAGDIVEDGNIRGFRSLQSIIESPKAEFELRFENTGNVHLRPEGEIKIFNMWGQERGLIPINQKTLFGNILSESIRSFNFTWEGEWSPADIGRYRAVATLAYGQDARQFTSSETSFWLIPWRVLLGIVLVILVIVFLISWLIRLYVKRMFAIAGLQNQNPLQKQLATEKHRDVSVVAPIEAGILDLRSRLANRESARLSTLFKFVSEYRMFFIGLLIICITIYIISWFISSVSDKNRAFEVKISGAGQEVVVDSESLQYEQQTTKVVAKRDVPPVTLVNRSGINGAAADVALVLEELGYTIDSVSTELNSTEEQTVIIYDPSVSENALELSTVLDNALLSAFTTEAETDIKITVYVGSDLAN